MFEEKRLLKVFLCHASQDKPVVRELSQRLIAEGWIDAWLDEKKLLPGQDWRVKIEEAVESSDLVIICLSSNSVSKEGFVQKELRYAREIALEKLDDAIFLVPLRLDDCMVPRGLRFYQWADYFGEKKEETYNALLESLKLRYDQSLRIADEEHARQEKGRWERYAAPKAEGEKAEPKAEEQEERIRQEKLRWLLYAAAKAEREKAEREVIEKAPGEKAELEKKVASYDKKPLQIPKKTSAPPKTFWESRLFSGIASLLIIILIFLAFNIAKVFGIIPNPLGPPTRTPGPSPTVTLTPTSINAAGQPFVINTSPPLSELLSVPYTPTALYVNTPRPPESADTYRVVRVSFAQHNWDEAIRGLQEVIRLEPDAADLYYYLGEAYRFKGDHTLAFQSYGFGLEKNAEFGPAYVGMARAQLAANPNADVLSLLDNAIRLDPNFGEAYLERARVKLRDGDIQGATADLAQADSRLPDSPLVYFTLAQARQRQGELDLALSAAKHANELDVTMLPVYLLLGQLYAEAGEEVEAANALGIYLKYQPEDSAAYLLAGKLYYNNGQFDKSLDALNRTILLDANQREAYLYRFLSNVELGNGNQAEEDMDTVLQFYPDSFKVNLATLRLHLIQDRSGSALLFLDKAEVLAETDEQKGLVYYWGAMVYEARQDLDKAKEYWQLLLDLPESATTVAMRNEAAQHLQALE